MSAVAPQQKAPPLGSTPGLRRPRSHCWVEAEQNSAPWQSELSVHEVEQVPVEVSQVPPQGQWASAKHSTQAEPLHTRPSAQLTAQAPVFSQVCVEGLQEPLPHSASVRHWTQLLPATVPSVRQKGASLPQAPQRAPQCRSLVHEAHSPLRQNLPSPHSMSLRHCTHTWPSRQRGRSSGHFTQLGPQRSEVLHSGMLSTQRPLTVSHFLPSEHWLSVVHSTQVGEAPGAVEAHWRPPGQQLQEVPAQLSLAEQA
jgi:hypothetical protein